MSDKKQVTVVFFVRHFSERGTEVAIYDYAHYNEEILGNKSVIVYLCHNKLVQLRFPIINTSFDKFKNRFRSNMIEINDISDMKEIIKIHNIDFFYTLTHGGPDIYNFNNKSIWENCKTIKHFTFNSSYPEGDYYISVDNCLNTKHSKNINYPVIPHIIYLKDNNENIRKELNIPEKAIVFGRYGGFNQFDITYVYEAIITVLKRDSNIYFLFMNTKPFYRHRNIIYLDKNIDLEFKSKFINTCDAMIHARFEGETFGMSVGEFSFMNKPVITTPSVVDNAHINILGDQAIIYNNNFDLINIFTQFKHIIGDRTRFDSYKKYTPEYVMSLFNSIFTS